MAWKSGSNHRARLFAGILLGSLAMPGADADQAPQPSAASAVLAARPRVGLVLAGGGAKGGAHVGVLHVLEEMRIPVDCIAGTSMGALVGAGYASGIPAAELEKFIVGIDWKTVVGGAGQRDLQPIEQKRAGVTYSNNLEVGLRDGRITLPGGLVNTSGIEDLLRSYVARARMQSSFDQLPIPFRAVATDMVTGTMVVLDRGDLATAMRASMAIPGAFAPVVNETQVLADGGMVRNIPVDVARKLCADVVIVVNLVEPAVRPEKLQSLTQLASRSTDVMIEANENLQLQSLTDRDVRIDVVMGDIGTADFERVPETIPLGEAAARAVAGRLAELAVPPTEYVAWREKVTANQGVEARLAAVRYLGLKRVNPEYLEQRAQVRAGDTVDIAAISAEAQRMSALQDFESVSYQLTGDPAAPTLEWMPREKIIGPDYLKLDLGIYGSDAGDIQFALYGKHTRTWLNSRGAEWRNEVQVGSDNLVSTHLYQPLDAGHRYFVEPQLFWTRQYQSIYVDNEQLARYRFGDYGTQLDVGANLSARSQVRLGYQYSRRVTRVDTGSPLLPEATNDDAGLVFAATYDSRDTPFNATRGLAAVLEYARSDESLGADRNWERIEAGLGVAVPVRNDVIWMTLAGGSELNGELPTDRDFRIGGPGSFPGYELGEILADEYWTASASYLWKIRDIMSIRGQALYAGLRLQGGEAYQRFDGVDDGMLYSASAYLTGRTIVGPLTIGFGRSNTDSWSLWLAVGRPIGQGTILERGIFR